MEKGRGEEPQRKKDGESETIYECVPSATEGEYPSSRVTAWPNRPQPRAHFTRFDGVPLNRRKSCDLLVNYCWGLVKLNRARRQLFGRNRDGECRKRSCLLATITRRGSPPAESLTRGETRASPSSKVVIVATGSKTWQSKPLIMAFFHSGNLLCVHSWVCLYDDVCNMILLSMATVRCLRLWIMPLCELSRVTAA